MAASAVRRRKRRRHRPDPVAPHAQLRVEVRPRSQEIGRRELPMRLIKLSAGLLVAVAAISNVAFAQGDAAGGKTYFQAACAACHSVNPGQNGVGPSLGGILGRKAGSVPEFAFTPALKGADLI